MKSFFYFMRICFVVLSPWNLGLSAQGGDVVICEILPDPSSVTDTYGEWFEVYNNSGTVINLLNWTIADLGTNSHTITTDLIIPAKGISTCNCPDLVKICSNELNLLKTL